MPIEALAAIFAAAVLVAVFALLLWGIARSSRRLLGRNDATATEAVARCVSCAERPVCETGALAGWLRSRPPRCPSLELLQGRTSP